MTLSGFLAGEGDRSAGRGDWVNIGIVGSRGSVLDNVGRADREKIYEHQIIMDCSYEGQDCQHPVLPANK